MNDRVVSTDWLADRLDAVRVVDVRDAWEYDGIGHVPGAVSIPFDTFRDEDSDDPGTLPGADAFGAVLGEAGITRDDQLVAYDDTHGVFAARFLVTAELYGHPPEQLHLLNGDYSAWTRGNETTTDSPAVDTTDYELQAPDFNDTPLVTREDVEAAVEDEDTVIVDTREDWEYAEGHIPGAVRLDWRDLVDDDSRGLRPADDIRATLDEHGIVPDRTVLLYCNTARRISHTYWVLRWLGYEDVLFYEGSLTEWEAGGGVVSEAE
jgi:thiosulfate/3-mercaptopyruvate sulfurtransferase